MLNLQGLSAFILLLLKVISFLTLASSSDNFHFGVGWELKFEPYPCLASETLMTNRCSWCSDTIVPSVPWLDHASGVPTYHGLVIPESGRKSGGATKHGQCSRMTCLFCNRRSTMTKLTSPSSVTILIHIDSYDLHN